MAFAFRAKQGRGILQQLPLLLHLPKLRLLLRFGTESFHQLPTLRLSGVKQTYGVTVPDAVEPFATTVISTPSSCSLPARSVATARTS